MKYRTYMHPCTMIKVRTYLFTSSSLIRSQLVYEAIKTTATTRIIANSKNPYIRSLHMYFLRYCLVMPYYSSLYILYKLFLDSLLGSIPSKKDVFKGFSSLIYFESNRRCVELLSDDIFDTRG